MSGCAAGARFPALILAALAALATACRSGEDGAGFDMERMVVQDRLDAYEASDLFADGKAMRTPPEGTVPHGARRLPAVVRTGREGGALVTRIPLAVTPSLLERGRGRYAVYCSPCHGADGMAATPVAAAMELRPPPALHDPALVAHSDGALFQVVSEGYGLMPGYGDHLAPEDRWAVVAYVRALQLSRDLPLDALPPDARDELLDSLDASGATPDPARSGGAP